MFFLLIINAFNDCLIVGLLVMVWPTALILYGKHRGYFAAFHRHLNGAGAATRCAAACRCIATPTDTDAAALSGC